MRAPGQYLYENYCLIFQTIFAPKWEELTEDSRSGWARLELATRIDCTCNSDPLGRCVVHPISVEKAKPTFPVPAISQSEVHWHPKGCPCGNCAGGTMPVHVLTITLPRRPDGNV